MLHSALFANKDKQARLNLDIRQFDPLQTLLFIYLDVFQSIKEHPIRCCRDSGKRKGD